MLIGTAIFGWPQRWPRPPGLMAMLPVLPVLLLLRRMLPATGFSAVPGFPSPALLEQLKQRLTQSEPCWPDCADLMEVSVSVTPRELTMGLDIAAAEASAVPLPGRAGDWEPLTIRVNQRPAAETWRGADGRLWLPLAAGVTRVELGGDPAGDASLTVPFPFY